MFPIDSKNSPLACLVYVLFQSFAIARDPPCWGEHGRGGRDDGDGGRLGRAAGAGDGRHVGDRLRLRRGDSRRGRGGAARGRAVAGARRGGGGAAGRRAGFIPADCADPAAVEAMAARAVQEMGGIDALVVSPGTTRLPELLFRQSLDDIRTALTQDLAPALYVPRAVLPAMMAQKSGAMVAIASDAGKLATPGEAVIGAGMAAIIQFMRGLAIEARRDGVRANTITPSLVEGTPLTERLMEEGRFGQAVRQARKLCSPRQAVSVNGGIHPPTAGRSRKAAPPAASSRPG
jgi:NAD(P)-dependent dehydrogenase (short-subunit alcohol dehydrogenase family)